MHYGVSGVQFFALHVVGLGSFLIVYKITLNDAATITDVHFYDYLQMNINYNYYDKEFVEINCFCVFIYTK